MKSWLAGLAGMALVGLCASSALGQTGSNCRIVDLKPGEKPPATGLSTSITAGNGRVTGSTSGPGGTVTQSTSGSGSMSTSVASDGRSTTVTDSNGNCTIYRQAEPPQ